MGHLIFYLNAPFYMYHAFWKFQFIAKNMVFTINNTDLIGGVLHNYLSWEIPIVSDPGNAGEEMNNKIQKGFF